MYCICIILYLQSILTNSHVPTWENIYCISLSRWLLVICVVSSIYIILIHSISIFIGWMNLETWTFCNWCTASPNTNRSPAFDVLGARTRMALGLSLPSSEVWPAAWAGAAGDAGALPSGWIGGRQRSSEVVKVTVRSGLCRSNCALVPAKHCKESKSRDAFDAFWFLKISSEKRCHLFQATKKTTSVLGLSALHLSENS